MKKETKVLKIETENVVNENRTEENVSRGKMNENEKVIMEQFNKVYAHGCRIGGTIAEFHILNLKFNLYKTFGVDSSDKDSVIAKILEAFVDACIKAMKEAIENEIKNSDVSNQSKEVSKNES